MCLEEIADGTGKKRKVTSGEETEDREPAVEVPTKRSAKVTKPSPPGASFKSARTKLIQDYHEKLGKQGLDGYKPPFLRKTSGTGYKGGFTQSRAKDCNAACTSGSNSTNGSALSARTMELLCGNTGELPASLSGFDPALIENVCSEILDDGAAIHWDDIAGQETAKQLVQEVVVWPMMNPDLFKGTRAPPRGLLLFGPPGTGKTLIGKAIASNIKATFFSISAGSLTTKWIGDGEKMVRILFTVAAALQPTVIFIDEIDSILSARKSDGIADVMVESWLTGCVGA